MMILTWRGPYQAIFWHKGKNEDLVFLLEPSDKVAKNPETVIHSAL